MQFLYFPISHNLEDKVQIWPVSQTGPPHSPPQKYNLGGEKKV